MNRKTIEVIVAPDGGIRMDAMGFKGADCEQATVFLERALGRISDKRKKPEYYHRAELHRQQRIGQ